MVFTTATRLTGFSSEDIIFLMGNDTFSLQPQNLLLAGILIGALGVLDDVVISIVNTLFLAYAGVALPLLLLISLRQPPFITFSQIINDELLATEIVRTLVGCMGLVAAVPISTSLAVYAYSPKRKRVLLTTQGE